MFCELTHLQLYEALFLLDHLLAFIGKELDFVASLLQLFLLLAPQLRLLAHVKGLVRHLILCLALLSFIDLLLEIVALLSNLALELLRIAELLHR